MERHAGVGAHEKASGCAGGGVWEMHKDYFHAQRFQSTGPEAPTTAQLVDQHSPLARRGAVICGLKLVPLNTRSPGPAELCKDDDIIDEALAYLRTDTMHRKWALDEPSEKTLVYLTRFLGSCLRALEQCPSAGEGRVALGKVALEAVALPCERGFPLEGMFEPANCRSDADALRGWLQQARGEAALRCLSVFYTPQGLQSAYWLDVCRKSRKFFTVFGTFAQTVEEEAPYKRNVTSSRSIEVQMTPEQQAAMAKGR